MKLTEDRIARIVEVVRGGGTRQSAASYAGISKSTLQSWIADARVLADELDEKKGRTVRERRLLDFLSRLTRAEADIEFDLVQVINRAAEGRPVRKTTVRTVEKVIGQDEDGEPIYAVETIEETIETVEFDWRAAAWWLERRNPGFSRAALNLNLEVSTLTDEQLERIASGDDPLDVLAN